MTQLALISLLSARAAYKYILDLNNIFLGTIVPLACFKKARSIIRAHFPNNRRTH